MSKTTLSPEILEEIRSVISKDVKEKKCLSASQSTFERESLTKEIYKIYKEEKIKELFKRMDYSFSHKKEQMVEDILTLENLDYETLESDFQDIYGKIGYPKDKFRDVFSEEEAERKVKRASLPQLFPLFKKRKNKRMKLRFETYLVDMTNRVKADFYFFPRDGYTILLNKATTYPEDFKLTGILSETSRGQLLILFSFHSIVHFLFDNDEVTQLTMTTHPASNIDEAPSFIKRNLRTNDLNGWKNDQENLFKLSTSFDKVLRAKRIKLLNSKNEKEFSFYFPEVMSMEYPRNEHNGFGFMTQKGRDFANEIFTDRKIDCGLRMNIHELEILESYVGKLKKIPTIRDKSYFELGQEIHVSDFIEGLQLNLKV
tara:strand:+ start:36147 stop:37262 length:1116 start_codon:yes stop_codon:yes gene_type:complete